MEDERSSEQSQFHASDETAASSRVDAEMVEQKNQDLVPADNRKKSLANAVASANTSLASIAERVYLKATDVTSIKKSSRSSGARPTLPNPNTGPQPGEQLRVVYEDDSKVVYVVDTGGVLLKLRIVPKARGQSATLHSPGNTPQQLSSAAFSEITQSNSTYETTQILVSPSASSKQHT